MMHSAMVVKFRRLLTELVANLRSTLQSYKTFTNLLYFSKLQYQYVA